MSLQPATRLKELANGRRLVESWMNPLSSPDSSLDLLYHLLDDWRTLTLAETASIRSSDWEALEKLHSQKLILQALIEEAELKFFGNESIPPELKSAERNGLRELASELVSMEEQNRATLSEQMAQADKQLKLSNKAISSLRHVQQAYGRSDRSFWQAYS